MFNISKVTLFLSHKKYDNIQKQSFLQYICVFLKRIQKKKQIENTKEKKKMNHLFQKKYISKVLFKIYNHILIMKYVREAILKKVLYMPAISKTNL